MRVGSLQKYYADHGGPQHGGHLSWPGTQEGFPVRGEPAHLRQSEYQGLTHVLDYKSGAFRMWVPEEKAAFDDVMDHIVNGWYAQHKRIDHFSLEYGAPLIWLEWLQIYGEIPNSKAPGAPNVV